MASALWDRLESAWAEVADLGRAAAVLTWDQLVNMPPGGADARGEQIATLRRLAHVRLVSPALGADLAQAEARGGDDPVRRAWIRVARREHERAARIPADLVDEMARAETAGYFAWMRARGGAGFPAFAPALARLLELARRRADAIGHDGRRYDALLGEHEPGLRTPWVAELFAGLREALPPLIARIGDLPLPSRAPLTQRLPEAGQTKAGERAISEFGYDWTRGRQDRSAHPFSTSFGSGDCRITTRIDPDDFGVGFFATLHEAGHALYEQGLPAAWSRGPLGQAASTGVHESQSRLWENAVGRSRAYWRHFLPELRRCLPGAFDAVSAEDMYRAVNVVRPSLIRVEADELTYSLHVALRFELEEALLSGDLPVSELPGAWNDGMAAMLGVRPETDARGCLQDVHWSSGGFGYFPSYTIGTVLAAQWMEAAERALGNVAEMVERGDFAPLLHFLRSRIHARGATLTPEELAPEVAGGPIDLGPFLRYVRHKYGELYDLD